MIDKRFFSIPYALFTVFSATMTILMILLCFEYCSFYRHVQELLILKQQYHAYITLLQNGTNAYIKYDKNLSCQPLNQSVKEDEQSMILHESTVLIDELSVAEESDEPDNDDDYDIDDSFIVINRQPEYLQQSTFDYMESQDLNRLMTAIDISQWADYTERVIATQSAKKEVAKVSESSKKIRTSGTIVRRPIKDFGFIWPIEADKFWLSSLFGPRKRINGSWGFHHGIDLAAIKGTAVKAAAAGVIVEASFQTGYGNTVVIKHNDHVKTRYAHLNSIGVKAGQKINQATIVGRVGETGFIRKKGKDGSHLHFEVYERGKRINPLHCLPNIR